MLLLSVCEIVATVARALAWLLGVCLEEKKKTTMVNITSKRLPFVGFSFPELHVPQLEMRVRPPDEAQPQESHMDRPVQVSCSVDWLILIWVPSSVTVVDNVLFVRAGASTKRARRRSRRRRGPGGRKSSSVPLWELR